MPADIPDIDGGHVPPGPDELGFTDDAFDARYDGKQPSVLDRGATARAGAGRPNPSPRATSATPRGRNAYMRTRARRLSASPPT